MIPHENISHWSPRSHPSKDENQMIRIQKNDRKKFWSKLALKVLTFINGRRCRRVDSPSTIALSRQLFVLVAVRYANELHPGYSTHSVMQNALATAVVVLIGLIASRAPAV